MAATGLQINHANVSFSSTPIDRITQFSISEGSQSAEWRGDTDLYPSVIAQTQLNVSANIVTGNIGVALTLPTGVTGTLAGTHKDAKGQSGGDVVLSLNCELTNRETGGSHGQWGQATLQFTGRSADGVTSPLSFSRS